MAFGTLGPIGRFDWYTADEWNCFAAELSLLCSFGKNAYIIIFFFFIIFRIAISGSDIRTP